MREMLGERLPDFTDEEWAIVKHSSDFYGMVSYFSFESWYWRLVFSVFGHTLEAWHALLSYFPRFSRSSITPLLTHTPFYLPPALPTTLEHIHHEPLQ